MCQAQITRMMLWLKTFYQIGLGQVFGAAVPFPLTHKDLYTIFFLGRSEFLSKGPAPFQGLKQQFSNLAREDKFPESHQIRKLIKHG